MIPINREKLLQLINNYYAILNRMDQELTKRIQLTDNSYSFSKILSEISQYSQLDFDNYKSSATDNIRNDYFDINESDPALPSPYTWRLKKYHNNYIIAVGDYFREIVGRNDFDDIKKLTDNIIEIFLVFNFIIRAKLIDFILDSNQKLKIELGSKQVIESLEINITEFEKIRDSSTISLFSLPENIFPKLADYCKSRNWKELQTYIKFIWYFVSEAFLYVLLFILPPLKISDMFRIMKHSPYHL